MLQISRIEFNNNGKHFTRLNFSSSLRHSTFNRKIKRIKAVQLQVVRTKTGAKQAIDNLPLGAIEMIFRTIFSQRKKNDDNENEAKECFNSSTSPTVAAIESSRALNRFQLNQSDDERRRNVSCKNLRFRRNGSKKSFLQTTVLFAALPFSLSEMSQIEEKKRQTHITAVEGNECVNWVIGLKVFCRVCLERCRGFHRPTWKCCKLFSE